MPVLPERIQHPVYTEKDNGRAILRSVARSGETYTTSQVAKIVGRSVDTVRRWRKAHQVVPSAERPMGELMVHVYTAEDVAKAVEFARTVKPGRPKGSGHYFGPPKRVVN